MKFRQVFNFKDPAAKGRVSVLIFIVTERFLTYIVTGIFYTAFLAVNDFTIVDASVLAVMPFLASLAVLFMPSLLQCFPKRKWILAACKLAYYFSNIIGVNIIVGLPLDENGRLAGMLIVTFLSSLFNVFATSGYAAWHIRFQPEEIRPYFLSVTQFLGALVAGVLTLLSGLLSDLLASMSPVLEANFLVILRYVAFGLGAVNVLFLLLPDEVEYPTVHTPRFSDILLIPLKNARFLRTMVVIFLWQFSLHCYSAQIQYYLIETIGMSMFYYNLIIFLYPFFFIFFSSFWQKTIRRTSWFWTYAVSLLIVAPFQVLYGFITPANYVWLVMLVCLPQHVAGVGHNVAYENLQYVNMPLQNRECYAAFYQIVFNIGSLAGMLFGTVFTWMYADSSFVLFGNTYYTGTPLLVVISGILQFVIVFYVLIFRRKLEPDAESGMKA